MDPQSADVAVAGMVLVGIVLGLLIVGFGPIGRAVARKIDGKGGAAPDLEALRQEHQGDLDAVRERMVELEERLDFTERLLARQREPGQLPGAGPRAGADAERRS